MSAFYARYVPPTSAPSKPTKFDVAQTNGVKRKHDREDEHDMEKAALKKSRSKKTSQDSERDPLKVKSSNVPAGEEHREAIATLNDDIEARPSKPAKRNKSKKLEKTDTSTEPSSINVETPVESKHKSIKAKFEKSKKQPKVVEAEEQEEQEPPELHGLEPLPQPIDELKAAEKPTYSTLPPWLASPVRVSESERAKFKDLGISKRVRNNLSARNMKEAFAIQAAIIPQLLPGEDRWKGDICISAATGSGKTLAYALPLIEALKEMPIKKLRGLIIVPTRELVKQAREVCEMCAAGTKLQIATAVGSKSLKEEQTMLVEKVKRYDPRQYKAEQGAPIDWLNTRLGDLMQEVIDEPEEEIDYVTNYESKVDILICTPGRLVDHLRSTKGFNLDYVQWLIVDEADRLLNESFQEWVEIVLPALQSEKANEGLNATLRSMRMEPTVRTLQKVILSATMTTDISKLNSMDLKNPRLVVLGDQKIGPVASDTNDNDTAIEPVPDENGVFRMPEPLSESAIIVSEEADKPLFLLHLLKTKIGILQGKPSMATNSDDISSSSDASSNSDSSEDSSGDSDSDSTRESDVSDKPSKAFIPPQSKLSAQRGSSETVLIFTRSTEATTRLTRLLCLLEPSLSSNIGTITKSTNSSSSRKAMTLFRQGQVSILIATDRASRGLDLPNLGHVISYDVPTSVITYVHRAGRTARAGKSGHAWTLLAHREGRWFWKQIGGKGEEQQILRKGKVAKVAMELPKDEELKNRYEEALVQLGEEVKGTKA